MHSRFTPSFRTSGWRYVSLDLALQVLAEVGYGAVEFCLEHPDAAPRCMDESRCAELVARMEELGLGFASVSWHGKREHPSLKEEYTLRLVEISARLRRHGAGTEVVVVGSSLPGASPEETEARFRFLVDLYRRACERAADHGLLLAVEPEPDTVIEASAEMDRLLDAVDHPALAVNLDLGHAEVSEGDVEAAIDHFADKLVHVHIEDIADRVHRHLVPGAGHIDLPSALRKLSSVGYDGPATIDLFDIRGRETEWSRRALEGLSACQTAAFS